MATTFTCRACCQETEHPVWVPLLPRGSVPYCPAKKCQFDAHRRARIAFTNHRPVRGSERAPVS